MRRCSTDERPTLLTQQHPPTALLALMQLLRRWLVSGRETLSLFFDASFADISRASLVSKRLGFRAWLSCCYRPFDSRFNTTLNQMARKSTSPPTVVCFVHTVRRAPQFAIGWSRRRPREQRDKFPGAEAASAPRRSAIAKAQKVSTPHQEMTSNRLFYPLLCSSSSRSRKRRSPWSRGARPGGCLTLLVQPLSPPTAPWSVATGPAASHSSAKSGRALHPQEGQTADVNCKHCRRARRAWAA